MTTIDNIANPTTPSYPNEIAQIASSALIERHRLHREEGEDPLTAVLWAVNQGGLLAIESVVVELIAEAISAHERLRTDPFADVPTAVATVDDVVYADSLPTGSEEDERIESLLRSQPS